MATFQRLAELSAARRRRPKLFFIYVLIDPQNEAVRYAGCCTDLAARYAQHLNVNNAARRVRAWVGSLFPQAPRLQVLHTSKVLAEARGLEGELIRNLVAAGCDLLNIRERKDRVAQEPPNRPHTLTFKAPRRGYYRVSTSVADLERRLRVEAYPDDPRAGVPFAAREHIGGCLPGADAQRALCGHRGGPTSVTFTVNGAKAADSKARANICRRCLRTARVPR